MSSGWPLISCFMSTLVNQSPLPDENFLLKYKKKKKEWVSEWVRERERKKKMKRYISGFFLFFLYFCSFPLKWKFFYFFFYFSSSLRASSKLIKIFFPSTFHFHIFAQVIWKQHDHKVITCGVLWLNLHLMKVKSGPSFFFLLFFFFVFFFYCI